MVLTTLPAGQNKFMVGNLNTPKRPNAAAHRPLIARAQKSDKNSEKAPLNAAKKDELKLAISRQKLESAAKSVENMFSEKDVKAFKQSAQQIANSLNKKLSDSNAKEKFAKLTNDIAKQIEDNDVQDEVSTIINDGVDSHLKAVEIAQELVESATNTASGKASVGKLGAAYLNAFFKYQQLGFETSGKMMKNTANFIVKLFNKSKTDDTPKS